MIIGPDRSVIPQWFFQGPGGGSAAFPSHYIRRVPWCARYVSSASCRLLFSNHARWSSCGSARFSAQAPRGLLQYATKTSQPRIIKSSVIFSHPSETRQFVALLLVRVKIMNSMMSEHAMFLVTSSSIPPSSLGLLLLLYLIEHFVPQHSRGGPLPPSTSP